jgi:hypothetical protein
MSQHIKYRLIVEPGSAAGEAFTEMGRRSCSFRQRDVTAAVKAVKAAFRASEIDAATGGAPVGRA